MAVTNCPPAPLDTATASAMPPTPGHPFRLASESVGRSPTGASANRCSFGRAKLWRDDLRVGRESVKARGTDGTEPVPPEDKDKSYSKKWKSPHYGPHNRNDSQMRPSPIGCLIKSCTCNRFALSFLHTEKLSAIRMFLHV